MTDKDYTAALYSGNFDMILLDYQGLSTSAYSFLAPFATRYSGEPVSVEDNSKGYTPSVTGFENAEYDAAIDAVLAATTRADRASLLHTAEGLFVKYMPAAPLVFYYDSYLVSSELTGLKNSAFGTRIFKDAVLKNYKDKNAAYLAKKDAKDKENTKSA
ncbi:Oligopeptide-binding protein OppA [bioreactor metagenome]|uniref:Oligopeptide-binding protein OppA n=1 Tax=bioreactor metagenome TaxID=1076179 RepID=A0A645FK49_9ZZZZ